MQTLEPFMNSWILYVDSLGYNQVILHHGCVISDSFRCVCVWYFHSGISIQDRLCLEDLVTAWYWLFRSDSRFVPSQWETSLLCIDDCHWLGVHLESALLLLHQSKWTCYTNPTIHQSNIPQWIIFHIISRVHISVTKWWIVDYV